VFLLPKHRTGFSIVTSQQFQIQNVDDTVIVQVCGSWGGAVVAHTDGHGVKLINDIVVINITRKQTDGWHSCSAAIGQRNGSLGTEETTGRGTYRVSSSRSRQAESAIRVGSHRAGR
jgi:hypothetical protein